MGNDLKGKELGVGILQEKSGLYSAGFVDRFGKRKHKRRYIVRKSFMIWQIRIIEPVRSIRRE